MKQKYLINGFLVVVGLIGALFWNSTLTAPPTPARAQSAFDCATVTEIPQTECAALVALYNSVSGSNWVNQSGWLQSVAPCSWFGVTCADGHVSQLVLRKNDLSGPLPPEIGNLTHLTVLDLAENAVYADPDGDPPNDGITALPAEIGALSNLTHLSLNHNHVRALPPEIGNLSNLTALDLYDNFLETLPAELGDLTNLSNLNLNNNDLSALPPEFGNLTHLTNLDLGNNALSTLPQEFGNLTHLTSLTLTFNSIVTLPMAIPALSGLTTLSLWMNQINELPPEIGELSNLTTLNLISNKLTALPPEIGDLSKLTNLYLSGNSLTTLPPEFGNLVNLKNLGLAGNLLTTLPPEFGNLANLTALDLSHCGLNTLPSVVFTIPNLTTLELVDNGMTTLSPEIGNLADLSSLNLYNNQLTSLPPEIGNLANLTSLMARLNELASLPPEIGNLANLTSLDLAVNKLTALPPEFGDLASLKWLDVSGNPTLRGVIPTFMAELTSMEELHFDGTQWCIPTSGPVIEWLSHITSSSAPLCTPLTTLTLDPIPELYAHIGATFTATAAPVTDHYPITFTWNADAHTPVTHTSTDLLTDTIRLTWDTPGAYTLTVAAANDLGVVTATQSLFVHPVSSTIILPDAPAQLVYTDTQGLPTTLDLPAGSVTQTATLLYHSQPAATAPVSWRPAGHSFVLGLYREGRALSQPLPAPAALTLRYSAADIAGIDRPADLQLMRRDAAGWQPAACGPVTHDLEQRVLSMPLCQLGEFALFGPATLTKFVEPATPIKNGETLTYTLIFSDPEGSTLRLFDPISPTLEWLGFVSTPPDGITFADGAISGTLTLSPTHPLTLSFTVRAQLPKATFIQGHAAVANTAYFCPTDTACIFRPSNTVSSDITSIHSVFLPLILR